MVDWDWWGDFAAILKLSFAVPSPRWSAEEVPSQEGKVVLITGGNAGIGKECARVLLRSGAKVYLACRSQERAEKAIADLKRESVGGGQVFFISLDLADSASVRKCAKEFLSRETKLDILFNNGGVSFTDKLTHDGFDYTFATNAMGHWLLTESLMPALLAASTPTQRSRVITVSSRVCYGLPLNFDVFMDGPVRKNTKGSRCYQQSKLANVIVAKEIARRHGDKIVSLSLHPGVIETEINRTAPPFLQKILTYFYYPVSMGALTSLWAGTAPEAADHNGSFLWPWARIGRMPLGAKDPAVGEKLWSWLEEKCAQRV